MVVRTAVEPLSRHHQIQAIASPQSMSATSKCTTIKSCPVVPVKRITHNAPFCRVRSLHTVSNTVAVTSPPPATRIVLPKLLVGASLCLPFSAPPIIAYTTSHRLRIVAALSSSNRAASARSILTALAQHSKPQAHPHPSYRASLGLVVMVHLDQCLLLPLLLLQLQLLPPVSRRPLFGERRSLPGEPVFDPLGLQRPLRTRLRQRIHGLERSDHPPPSYFWCCLYSCAHSTADVCMAAAGSNSIALVLCGVLPGVPQTAG